MSDRARSVVRACAVLSSTICLFAGAWLLTAAGFDHDNDASSTAIGLYFIGKGFFLGPMLWIAADGWREK